MPALHRSALLALGAAMALCACNSNASPQNTGSQNAGSQPGRPSEAPLACAGPADTTCGPDAYCKEGETNAGGRCAPKPQICPMIYHPVCGSDGKTYPNTCHAERAGVNLAHSGACEK